MILAQRTARGIAAPVWRIPVLWKIPCTPLRYYAETCSNLAQNAGPRSTGGRFAPLLGAVDSKLVAAGELDSHPTTAEPAPCRACMFLVWALRSESTVEALKGWAVDSDIDAWCEDKTLWFMSDLQGAAQSLRQKSLDTHLPEAGKVRRAGGACMHTSRCADTMLMPWDITYQRNRQTHCSQKTRSAVVL